MMDLFDARAAAARLRWREVVGGLIAVLHDPVARVPPHLLQPLPGGSSLGVMRAVDAEVASMGSQAGTCQQRRQYAADPA